MKRQENHEQIKRWQQVFKNEIVGICVAHDFTLHQAFDYFRENDREKYEALSGLWNTYSGKIYLKDAFAGGKVRVKK